MTHFVPSPPLSTPSDQRSETGKPAVPPGIAGLRARWQHMDGWLRRSLKIGAAGILLAAGLLAELGTVVRVQSTDAVVSAPRIGVRAPIGGMVAAGGPTIGQTVKRGAVLARLSDPRVSRLPLEELETRAARLRAELAAAAQRRDELVALQADLTQRAQAHSRVLAARFDAEIAGADATVAADAARQEQSRRELARRRTLAAGGDVTTADLERSQMAYDTASQEGAAQEAQRRSLRTQRNAAAVGVYAEPGANDTSYAAERRDEVALRMGDLDQSVAVLTADLAETDAMAAATAADIAKRGEADILAPTDGIIWRNGAHEGDLVAAGDIVADLVACDQAVVVAAITQRDLTAILVGGTATVRLSGETQDRKGRVLATLAEGAIAGDPRLAALPTTDKIPGAVALVALGPSEDTVAADAANPDGTACMVGRNARVLLPRGTHGGLRDLLDWVL